MTVSSVLLESGLPGHHNCMFKLESTLHILPHISERCKCSEFATKVEFNARGKLAVKYLYAICERRRMEQKTVIDETCIVIVIHHTTAGRIEQEKG